MTAALELKGITKYFLKGTPNQVKALDAIDLKIEPGDFVCIIGSNGAGKSTLIKTVSGLSIPDRGTVLFEGADITRQPPHRWPAPRLP